MPFHSIGAAQVGAAQAVPFQTIGEVQVGAAQAVPFQTIGATQLLPPEVGATQAEVAASQT
ncbi:MAG: hypothetical protein PHQ05_08585 [Sterolibacterium sp.]|nr:hypothetical protein [Sterolibacterium sp.]